MKLTAWVKHYVVMAGLGTALLSAGCAMMEPKAERYVPPPIGATWTQSVKSTGSFGSGNGTYIVTLGERVWNGARMISMDSPAGSLLINDQGAFVAFVVGGKPVRSWDPPHNLDWPLIVGKKSVHAHRFTNHVAGSTEPYEASDTVEAYEDVTVGAGTFKAFRIRSVENNGFENLTWFSPELGIPVKQSRKRGITSPAGPGTQDMEVVSQSIRK